MDRYSSYKDSGIEWIGEIPSHWVINCLKHQDLVIMGQSPNSKDYVENISSLPFLQGNADFKEIYPLPRIYCDTANKIAVENDILLSVRAPIGAVNIANKKYGIGRGLCAIRAVKNNYKFIYYHTLLEHEELNSLGTGSTFTAISAEDVKNAKYVFPPLSEQQEIVAFLDNKTEKIDKLILYKEKEVELLKEKRTSHINHVVTKGLDPNVGMKDSGVEWIGEIPNHWKMKKVKYLFEIRKRISGELGFDVLSVTQKGLKVKDIISGKGQVSMDYTKYQIVEEGDFVMNHMDLLTGYVDISNQLGVTSPDYRVFTLIDSDSNSDFYLSIFQFGYQNKIFYGFGQGSSMFGRWRLPSRQFNEFKFPYPILKEQEGIVKYLKEQEEIIDNTIRLEQNKIELLKEYRQSLISEVITGKIRVCKQDRSIKLQTA